MKVGDLVRHRSNYTLSAKPGAPIGTVISIREGRWPIDWDLSDESGIFEMKLCKRVDVLWQGGDLTESIPSGSLQVVIKS